MDTKKKVIITTATMAAAVTTGAIATTAHADQVNANVNTNTNTQTAQGQSDLKTAQDQSRQNYADAKSANDAAQADLNNAKSANVNAENAQTAASAQETQDAIAQQNAQDSVNAASNALAQAQSDAAKTTSDPAAVDKAQSDANAASQANSQAQADLNQASENVKTAQDQAGKAQASFNQAQDQVTQANNNVKTASDAVSQAQTDLNNTKNHQQALSDAQQAVTSAQSQKDAADTNVNNAQNDFNSKQSAANSAKTNLDNAKTALDNVQKNAPVENHITVNDTYINELKKHRGEQIISNDPALDSASHELGRQNKYHSDPAAKSVTVHFDSNGVLSEADTIYATQYAAQLINEIRSQIGSPLVKINTGSIEISRDVANQYRADDNLNIYNHGHDNNGLNKVQQTWNTTISESLSGDSSASDYDIDTNTQVNDYQGYTRDDLQRSVYEAITGFLFSDSLHDYGHTTDVLATRYPAEYNTPNSSDKDNNGNYYMNYGEIYLGVSFDYDTSNTTSQMGGLKVLHPGQLHFISEWDPDSAYAKIVEQHAEHPETGNEKYRQSQWRQEIAVPTVTDQASAIKSAQTEVNKAQSAYDAAQAALAQAQTALDQAKSAQASAQEKLAQAQANLQRVQAETPSVDDAQAKLTAAQNKLASAKQMAQNAQKALENAQATKANADHALEQAENTLAGAKTKAANAQVALKQANDKLNAVLGANKKIEDAQTKLDAAKAALQVAKSNHDTSAKKLSEAKDAVKTAQDNLAKAQAHADATAKALANAKEALITDAKVYHDSVSIKPVTIHKGENVPAPEIANPMTQDPTQSLVMGAYLKLAASKLDTIPTGTTAAWSNKAQLASAAQIVGNHQEGATVTFPDGSTMTLNVPLVVLDTETPVTPVTPSNPDQGKTDDHGTAPVTPSKPDQGKTDPTKPVNPTTPSKPSNDHQTDTNKPSDNSHVTTPKDDTKTDTTTNTTLPSDAHVVDGQVVNAQGQVIPGFKVENGTIVATNNSATTASVNTTAPVASATTMTREQYRASQNNKSNTDAKTLPQTGNHNQAGLVGLGIATLISMFGLAATNKKY